MDAQDEDEGPHVELGIELEALVTSAGITWNEYSTCGKTI